MSHRNLYFPPWPLFTILSALRCNECRQWLAHCCTLVSFFQDQLNVSSCDICFQRSLLSQLPLRVPWYSPRVQSIHGTLLSTETRSGYSYISTFLLVIFSSGSSLLMCAFHSALELRLHHVGFYSTIPQGFVLRIHLPSEKNCTLDSSDWVIQTLPITLLLHLRQCQRFE